MILEDNVLIAEGWTHIVDIDIVIPLKQTIYNKKCKKLDQDWADHAVAYPCRDVIMNQWSTVFNFYEA